MLIILFVSGYVNTRKALLPKTMTNSYIVQVDRTQKPFCKHFSSKETLNKISEVLRIDKKLERIPIDWSTQSVLGLYNPNTPANAVPALKAIRIDRNTENMELLWRYSSPKTAASGHSTSNHDLQINQGYSYFTSLLFVIIPRGQASKELTCKQLLI